MHKYTTAAMILAFAYIIGILLIYEVPTATHPRVTVVAEHHDENNDQMTIDVNDTRIECSIMRVHGTDNVLTAFSSCVVK